MLHIALFEPRIAQNTGNIIRLVSNNGCQLHLIEPLGFDLEEKKLRRAGLDYLDLQRITLHKDFDAFAEAMGERRIFAITTKGRKYYHEVSFQSDDVLLFGAETHGLTDDVRAKLQQDRMLRIPMFPDNRSLNLSNSVALVSYEAWRQLGFEGGL